MSEKDLSFKVVSSLTNRRRRKVKQEFFLDMMEETPPMDQNNHDLNEPWDPVTDRSIMLEKNKEIKKSKYIHSTLVDGTGVIIQFINSQPAHAKGAAEVFGGIRINLMDPERVPNYLDKYESTIRYYARVQLEEHLIRGNHPAGVNEPITDDDFGMNFAWGTLSATGRKASPSPRGEGPIWYAIYPTLIEPINVSRDPSMPEDWMHIINCYINLVNKQGRRSYHRQLATNNNENKEPNKAAKRQNQDNNPPFKGSGGRGGYQGGYQKRPRDGPRDDKESPKDQEERDTRIAVIAIKKYNQEYAPERMYPGLPTSGGDPSPKWEKKGFPPLPEY